MSKFLVSVFRVSGQIDIQVEATSVEAARAKALGKSESEGVVFGEPDHRRVAIIYGEAEGGQLSEHADREPANVIIHVVPAREVDAEGRVPR